MVGTVHGQSADGEIRAADGFDFLDAGFFRGFVDGGNEIPEQGERLAFPGAGAEFLHADDLGEEDADVGEFAVGFLVAFAALCHGRSRQNTVQQFLIFLDLPLELFLLRFDAGRHVVEDGGEFAEFVLRFDVDPHIGLARPETVRPFGEAAERLGEKVRHNQCNKCDDAGQGRGGNDHAAGEGTHRAFGFGQIHFGQHAPA